MKKEVFVIFLLLMLSLSFFVSAESYTISIKGEPRTPNEKIDLMYDAGAMLDGVKFEGKTTINNDEGYFEVKDISFEAQKQINGMSLDNVINIYASGSCFNHVYNLIRKGDHFEIIDGYFPEKGVILSTKENLIDLGILKEDRSNQIMVDTDVPVSFQAFDMSGKEVALNTGYNKFTGMSDSFYLNSKYKIVIESKAGKKWEKIVTTGNYCESTRIVKRGNYFVVENFPNNSFPPIGFFRNIWISILGFRMIVILPLIAIFLVIMLVLFLIIRKRKVYD